MAAIAVAASALIHAAILAFMVATLDAPLPGREPAAILVSLVPPVALARRTPPARARPARPGQNAAAPARAAVAVSPPTIPPPDADPAAAAQAGLRGAVGASVRCAHPDVFALDAAERERCRRMARDLASGAPTYAAVPANAAAAADFEHARRMNEAWRAYHNSRRLDDHPGLAAMFGKADPCPPGPVCWRRLPR